MQSGKKTAHALSHTQDPIVRVPACRVLGCTGKGPRDYIGKFLHVEPLSNVLDTKFSLAAWLGENEREMQTLIYDPKLNCLSLCNSLFFTAGWGEQSACSVILPSSSPYINCADLEQSFITSTGTCISSASSLDTTDS